MELSKTAELGRCDFGDRCAEQRPPCGGQGRIEEWLLPFVNPADQKAGPRESAHSLHAEVWWTHSRKVDRWEA